MSSFCDRFVTFVWDNNDINPDTLSGESMHCTNGIIIQETNHGDVVNNFLPSRDSIRKRSYSALPGELASYAFNKRCNPAFNPIDISEEPVKQLNNSRTIDFLWVLSSMKAKVPNWTGFNQILHDNGKDETIQIVAFLPAINQSPTSLDTVLELLLQSKAKAMKIGLSETDVVVDQAIYAKAVDILANPTYKDLKEFIVLRMGAFHIASNFISVIGKRFKDAGLKDILVEAKILGKITFSIYLNCVVQC